MRTASYSIALSLGLALTLSPGPALAQTTNCTPITVVPTTITVEGNYCFTQHLSTDITSGDAITIETNNVVLDLDGWTLSGLAAGRGTAAHGIRAENRQNITIKNGTVRGFLRGIRLFDTGGASKGHVVEDIRADQNTAIGIQVYGRGNLIRNNQVVATGGSTVFGPNTSPFGIIVSGAGPRVLNNDVIDTFAQGTGIAVGIGFLGSGGLAVNNRITNAHVGIEFLSGSTGKYRDNLTTGVPTISRFLGGTSVGTNN
ncbi:MAG TPA: hypothetical protein VGB42_10305 [Candidatus Thermoplasmatota archaeon]